MRVLSWFAAIAAAVVIAPVVPGAAELPRPAMVNHFYYWKDQMAADSLHAHARQIDLLSPVWLEVDDNGRLVSTIEPEILAWAVANGIPVMPVVVNRGFRPETAAIAGGALRNKLVRALVKVARQNRFSGLQLDFEGLRETDRNGFTEFAERLGAELHRSRMQFSIAVPAPLAAGVPSSSNLAVWKPSEQSAAFDYARLGGAADFITLMTYDEYTSPDAPGPVAGIAWMEACLRHTLASTPAAKVMLGLPLYHRHWAGKKVSDGPYSVALALAQTAGSEILLDANQQEATFRYTDAQAEHVVWLETADSLARRAALALKYRLRGISAWRLGQEDPSAWETAFEKKSEKKI